jgi:hypothetical protein
MFSRLEYMRFLFYDVDVGRDVHGRSQSCTSSHADFVDVNNRKKFRFDRREKAGCANIRERYSALWNVRGRGGV